MPSPKIVDLRKKKPGAPQFFGQAPLPLRPEKRVSPVRVRRRRTRIITVSIIAALLVALTLVLSYLSYLPRYSITSVDVVGAQSVSPNAVADYAESIIYNGSHALFSHANIFLYPRSLIEQDIPQKFPRVQSASVSRASLLSNAITVTINERQLFALWCDAANNCYDMDKTGFIFANASANASSSNEYIFSGGTSTSTSAIGQTFAPGHTQGLVAFMQLLAQAGFTPLGAQVQSDEDFTVPLSEGFSVYASFGQDSGTLVSNLQLVLSSQALQGQEQNLDYVDLRFGDKVYYKLQGQSQQAAASQ